MLNVVSYYLNLPHVSDAWALILWHWEACKPDSQVNGLCINEVSVYLYSMDFGVLNNINFKPCAAISSVLFWTDNIHSFIHSDAWLQQSMSNIMTEVFRDMTS